MLNFDILEKVLGIVFHQFVYDFSRKMFLLYSIKCTYFIVLITFTSWDIGQYVYRNFLFEINLISLIKLFSTRPESQDKI